MKALRLSAHELRVEGYWELTVQNTDQNSHFFALDFDPGTV